MASIPLALDEETEVTALKLLRHLEWQPQGFSLVFLFADVGSAAALADWLDERLAFAGRPLQRHEAPTDFPDRPDAWLDQQMAALADWSQQPGAVWLALHRHPQDRRWSDARRELLARLNERRYLLETQLLRPLVLVLPVHSRSEARMIAPDIWHVRALSAALRVRAGMPDEVSSWQISLPESSHTGAAEALPRDAGFSAYEEWQRIASSSPHRAYLPTAWNAVDELRWSGRVDEALGVARQAEDIARDRVRQTPHDVAALRDLSLSLNNVGRIAQVQGSWAQAEAVYRESLELSRELSKLLGRTPESLRDLSISLNNIGRIAESQGDWAKAEAAYRESLGLSRELSQRLGRSPESLRDLSVHLGDIGRIAESQGDWARAGEAYSEGLNLRRQLSQLLGRSPESLRDLSVSLDNNGRVAEIQGEWGQAEAMYRESLELRRELSQRLGPTPESLRDLSVSLDNIARIAESQGDREQAEATFLKSLELSRELSLRLGRTPESLRDLSVSLGNVGLIAESQGKWAQAEAAYKECLELRRELSRRLGRTPQSLNDLGASLALLAQVPGRAEVISLLREAEAIYMDLTTSWPQIPQYQERLNTVRALLRQQNEPTASIGDA